MSFGDPSLRCRKCFRARATVHHHVIYQQEIERLGGDTGDSDSTLSMCTPCHQGHHQPGLDDEKKIKLVMLRDENYHFATKLMGTGLAYEYLRRRYTGDDSRLDALLN